MEQTLKIAFVYAGGRHLRRPDGPSDFFYGARELSKTTDWEVDCLEVDDLPADPLTGFFTGRLFGRFVPPRTSADWIARTRRILPKLVVYDLVVATATELTFGLAFWKSLGMLPKPLVGMMLGAVTHPIRSEIRRYITASLLGHVDGVLFAGAEEEEIRRRFSTDGLRLKNCCFGVDDAFWVPPGIESVRHGILSVGNDGRRDYDLMLRVAALMPDEKFHILTRQEAPRNLSENVHWHSVSGQGKHVSIEELLPLYQKAACVVVPLKESPQPSGQSVAMQAMMCGAPVVITRTRGWWGVDVLQDGKHLRLVDPDNALEMAAAIRNSLAAASIGGVDTRKVLLEARWTATGFAERLAEVIRRAMIDGNKGVRTLHQKPRPHVF